jgi:ubiquinol-cytochrome c reductase cytochrome c subunit
MSPRARSRSEARTLSRILRIGLLVAVLGQLAWSFRPSPSVAQTDQLALGQQLYETNCTTCHGTDATGTDNGPSLQGVGPAAVNFQVSTGRMPLANPADQPQRQPSQFTPEETAALVAYVASIAPGGPAIPDVSIENGNLATGMSLYLGNCASCHGAGASGDSVGGGQIAPGLNEATPTQIGEAIRTGPGVMPRFGERTLTPQDVDSIAAYLVWLRSHAGTGGDQLGRVGAVAEGLVAVVIGLGLIVLVLRLTGARL